MKIGLVLEGGAMRGMFTAGVLDVMMENNIHIDGAVGVSAGAVFGCNYKSKQIGRSIRYNTKYCSDPRYVSWRSLIKTGDLYNARFCYKEIPESLDPFDVKTFSENPMEFYVVATDVYTGKPVYHLCTDGGDRDIQWMRASASMPLVSRTVSVDGYDLLDGGVSDSIPIEWFRSQGYKRNIVILTRPEDYRKKKTSAALAMRISLRKYPSLVDAMLKRHEMYNSTLDKLKEICKEGDTLVIQPPSALEIKRVEKNPDKLLAVYMLGRSIAKERMEEIKGFTEAVK